MFPISAVVGMREVLGLFKPGSHGSTFGGSPLACAVARESLKVIVEERLPERSRELGDYFKAQLQAIHSPYVKEIRGKGLFIGVELKDDVGGARPFCEALKERGILAKETHDTVIRFAPPLIISKEKLDWALSEIRAVLTK
jgi:ornithine--oxo-acid transaminase